MVYAKLIKKICPHRLSKTMKIPPSTIYSWKKTGIPSWRIEQIKKAAEILKVDISDCYCE